LSAIFLTGIVSNPLFGGLSDRGRIRWTSLVLVIAAIMIIIFPRVTGGWILAVLVCYGFFFMASYPMVEAALMQSVPDAVRGRVFGFFITIAGLVGNLAHWLMGNWVKTLGSSAGAPNRYYEVYALLAFLVILSLAGLPCLHAIRQRERLEEDPLDAAPSPHAALRTPDAP
jgi:MFS family permease